METLRSWLPVEGKNINRHSGGAVWVMEFAEKDAIRIGNWIYSTNHFGMDRKRQKYREGCRLFIDRMLERADCSKWSRVMTEFTRAN